MADPTKHVQVQVVGDVVVARLVGEEIEVLYDWPLIREVGDYLYTIAADHPGRSLVLNLERVKYAATEMLAKVTSLNSRMAKHQGQLHLCGLRPDVEEALRILRLHSLFDVHATEAAALAHCGAPSNPAPAPVAGRAGDEAFDTKEFPPVA